MFVASWTPRRRKIAELPLGACALRETAQVSVQQAPARRRPDLTPVQRPAWWTIGVASAVAVIDAMVVFVLLAWLLGLPLHVSGTDTHALEQRKLLVEVFKIALGLAVGLGAVVALALNYRRHRIEESQSHRDDQRLFTERFQSAAEQLGHGQPAVRLAGVHALSRLADDWEAQRQTCIDVLCAYIRLPPTVDASGPSADPAIREPRPITLRAELEVRQTIVRLIANHLRVAPDNSTQTSWRGHDFDLTGARFDGAFDFSGAHFSGGTVNLRATTFSRGTVDLTSATFSGGTFNLAGATFSGSTVDLTGASFSGGTFDLTGASFSGGTFNLTAATYCGGTLKFNAANFSGGTVSFDSAMFSGGRVDFAQATFSRGTVSFSGVRFCGSHVGFDQATFSGGTVNFGRARFSGGTVSFSRATFSGGTVAFHDVTPSDWSCPPIFDPWEQLPAGLTLPKPPRRAA